MGVRIILALNAAFFEMLDLMQGHVFVTCRSIFTQSLKLVHPLSYSQRLSLLFLESIVSANFKQIICFYSMSVRVIS